MSHRTRALVLQVVATFAVPSVAVHGITTEFLAALAVRAHRWAVRRVQVAEVRSQLRQKSKIKFENSIIIYR